MRTSTSVLKTFFSSIFLLCVSDFQLVLDSSIFWIREETATEITLPSNIPVFYNLYLKRRRPREYNRVKNIVDEQLSMLREEHHPVYVHSIGHMLPVPNTTLLKHHSQADETVTLRSLWKHCRKNPHDKVVYLHSKGSFTRTPENERLRRFLTTGALSQQCSNLPSTCNVCASRFSPTPHPHTSGNMWLARCSYISKLTDPKKFEKAMSSIYGEEPDACIGTGRYAAEHWVYSHPEVKPCDLYTDPSFVWGYDNLPETGDFEKDLSVAPRFNNRSAYVKTPDPHCPGRGFSLKMRIAEYQLLYNRTPGESWWGWNFYDSDS